MNLQELLRNKRACSGAREWLGEKDLREAWETCPRADWLIWALGKFAIADNRQIVEFAISFARGVLGLGFVPEDEHRPRLAVEAAECCIAEPSRENISAAYAAADAASAYADDVADAASAYVAYVAANAAYVAASATDAAAYPSFAAYVAADAADAAAYAASATDAADARAAKHAEMCATIRDAIQFRQVSTCVAHTLKKGA